MKKLYFSIIALAIVHTSFAQWTTSGNDIYNTNTGKVGIGTTSPLATFEINGNMGTIDSRNFRLTYPGGALTNTELSGLAHLSSELGLGWTALYAKQGSASYAAVFNGTTYFTNGNVGIGTTNPSQALTVVGNILGTHLVALGNVGISSDIDARIYLNNTTISGKNWNIISDPSSAFEVGIYGSAPFQTITSSGNVGIGTTNPAYMLDVLHAGTGSALNITGYALGTRNDVGIDFSAQNGSIVKYANIGLQITNGALGRKRAGSLSLQ
jgi:hypothetical protein